MRELKMGTMMDFMYSFDTAEKTNDVYNHALLRLPLHQNYEKEP